MCAQSGLVARPVCSFLWPSPPDRHCDRRAEIPSPQARDLRPATDAPRDEHRTGRASAARQAARDSAALRRLCGLVWLRLLDGRPLSRLDRRRLCEGRQHDHRTEGVRLYRAKCWSATTSGEGRPGAGPDRRPRFQGGARSGQGRCRRARRPRWRASSAQLDVQQQSSRRQRRRWTSTRQRQTFAEQENKRYADLAETGFGSVQNAQHARRAIPRRWPPLSGTMRTWPRRRSRSTC